MTTERREAFPLFPLSTVLLPTEAMPLHIFEPRYKRMIGELLETPGEFGLIWLADDGLKEIGCTASISEVLERADDGRINIACRGESPFRLLERSEQASYPTGTIETITDPPDDAGSDHRTRDLYADLIETATDNEPNLDEIARMNAYAMASRVEIELVVKQQLLELRSEQARLDLLAPIFQEGVERLQIAKQIGEQAKVNGKVRFKPE